MSERLRACLQDMVGSDVAVALANVTGDTGLLGSEAEAVASAIPKRQAEFAAGRRAAREAFRHLDIPPVAIPQGVHRAPVWPGGIVGSITHDNGLAMAAVARADVVGRIGIDLAEWMDFPDHLRGQILLSEAEASQSGLEARVTFSAKECFFKAFYADAGSYFGFGAVEVQPDIDAGTFAVRLLRDIGTVPAGRTFVGCSAVADGRLVTSLVTPV